MSLQCFMFSFSEFVLPQLSFLLQLIATDWCFANSGCDSLEGFKIDSVGLAQCFWKWNRVGCKLSEWITGNKAIDGFMKHSFHYTCLRACIWTCPARCRPLFLCKDWVKCLQVPVSENNTNYFQGTWSLIYRFSQDSSVLKKNSQICLSFG